MQENRVVLIRYLLETKSLTVFQRSLIGVGFRGKKMGEKEVETANINSFIGSFC